MKYITGIHALNVPCSLNTSGDWHHLAIRWDRPHINDTRKSFFGNWGIEFHEIPLHSGNEYPVANHIRACLDMLDSGDFSNLQGMRRDYICTNEYDPFIFFKVAQMRMHPHWDEIDHFMEKEYLMEWVRYKERDELDGTGRLAR